MPTVDLGTKKKEMRLSEVAEVIDSDKAALIEAVTTFGASVVTSALVGGLAGVAFSIGFGVKTLQDIQNLMDIVELSDQATEALEDFENNNYKGEIVCVFQKEKWVSNNGNINSGTYYYPIEIYHQD